MHTTTISSQSENERDTDEMDMSDDDEDEYPVRHKRLKHSGKSYPVSLLHNKFVALFSCVLAIKIIA